MHMPATGIRVWPGKWEPLGATPGSHGVNFAVFSAHAEEIELCLFANARDAEPVIVVPMTQKTRNIWHCLLPGCHAGQFYGYRAHGPYAPDRGLRFNPAKLLLDPYARAITGKVDWSRGSPLSYAAGTGGADAALDQTNSASAMPKCVVVDPHFDWDGDSRPATSLHRSVIYELHVRGFTRRFPGLDPALQGTYAGLASPPVLKYLKQLGVTAVELLPVHHCEPEKFLLDRGLTNYWGYNTIGFFAPDSRFSSAGTEGGQVGEFKQMVKRLHRAGIEVIVDVVYNHTAEGSELGPTLSYRGLDNDSYYWLDPADPRRYLDFTGCGNTPRVNHPDVLKLIMDSLRYWVREMHVDGFRFDLAPTLARGNHGVDRLSGFFDILHQDPVLNTVKLIAEPWDVAHGGYQVGNFPVDWSEWNGRYRDTVRSFWKGDAGMVPDLARRLTGSSDLYGDDGRSPSASINFITCHDGFTLADLVSYGEKHNQANLEDNRDGNDNNLSWNCGVEGPATSRTVLALRERQMRNFFATLLLSQGTPMIQAGDEIGRTQGGNNNAYCQDNETSWVDWTLLEKNADLHEFVGKCLAFRARHPAFRLALFLEGRARRTDLKDIMWLRPDGSEMTQADWDAGYARSLGFLLDGRDLHEMDERGVPLADSVFLVLMNADEGVLPFRLPAVNGGLWQCHMETTRGWLPETGFVFQHAPGDTYSLAARSMALFEWVAKE